MDQFYKDVVQFQYRCKDWIDTPSSPSARALQQEVQRLEDESQVRKNAGSLDTRVQSIMRILKQVGSDGSMSYQHAEELIDQAEAFRQQLRKF